MSAPAVAFLSHLRQQGVEAYIQRGDIRVKCPARALAPKTYQRLAYFNDDLIELLWNEPVSPPPGQEPAFASSPADGDMREALFVGDLSVQVRQDSPGRCTLWFTRGAAWHRRKDFATPFLDHSRPTAELWYGEPIGGWRPPSGEPK